MFFGKMREQVNFILYFVWQLRYFHQKHIHFLHCHTFVLSRPIGVVDLNELKIINKNINNPVFIKLKLKKKGKFWCTPVLGDKNGSCQVDRSLIELLFQKYVNVFPFPTQTITFAVPPFPIGFFVQTSKVTSSTRNFFINAKGYLPHAHVFPTLSAILNKHLRKWHFWWRKC